MRRDASKETFWRQVLGECESGGQSVREFCRQRELKESLFYAWRRELGRRDGAVCEKPGFVELVGSVGGEDGSGVSIRIDERVWVVLERGFDRETLQAALGCLCAMRPAARAERASTDARGTRAP